MHVEYSATSLGDEIVRAYQRLFHDDLEGKSAEMLRWRFVEAPHGPGYFAVARDRDRGGEIIGIVGFVASRLQTSSGPIPAFQAVDLIVDPAYRGRGVFAGLGKTALDHAAALGAKLVWGFPNPNAAPGWFGRFKWLNFGTAPFLVRPLRTGYFLARLVPFLRRMDLRLVGSRGCGPEAEVLGGFDHSLGTLWSHFAAGADVAVVRDPEWLNWRLAAHPERRYRNAVRRDAEGRIVALVSSYIGDKHGGRILYVMEALARDPSKPELRELLRCEVAHAADQGADAALAWCQPHSPNRAAYGHAGFLPLPDRLRPITINFGAKPLAEDLPAEVRDAGAWYLSYVDSDTN